MDLNLEREPIEAPAGRHLLLGFFEEIVSLHPGWRPDVPPRASPIDTGAESVLADAWLADLGGVDLGSSEDRLMVGIGGQVVALTFVEVDLVIGAA